MSALVMGLVWELQETPEFGRAEKFVLMAYADHADSNGRNIYPSVNLVMRKTFYEERNVQKITRVLETLGLLVPDGVGPHGTNRFAIPIERTSDGGAKIAPAQKEGAENAPPQKAGAENAPEGNAPEGNAPEPSVVEVKESSNNNGVNIFKLYEQEFGGLTPMIADAIKDTEKTYPADWIPEAMQIAVERNVRNWKFVEGILKRCKAKNVRPSLNKLEAKHANGNNGSGNTKGAGSKQQKPVARGYSDADRAAADAINKSVAVR